MKVAKKVNLKSYHKRNKFVFFMVTDGNQTYNGVNLYTNAKLLSYTLEANVIFRLTKIENKGIPSLRYMVEKMFK